MIAIVTYIQEMRAQGRTDKQCLGFKSRGYSGYMKNDIFVQETIFGREDELSAEQKSSKLGADEF